MAPALTPDPIVSPSPADQPAATGGAMSVDEFCRYGCVGKTKLYSEAKAGRITLRKIGAKTVVLREEGDAWLRSLPTATAAADLDTEPA